MTLVENYLLKFEFILHNHLRVLSESYAQKLCDLEGMVRIYEQYAMTKMTMSQRDVLRKFKLVMNFLRHEIQEYYKKELKKFEVYGKKYEEVLNEMDSQLREFDDIYYNYLLRWTIACTNKEYSESWHPYAVWEFFEDLKIELLSRIGFFDEDKLEEVFEEHGIEFGKRTSNENRSDRWADQTSVVV